MRGESRPIVGMTGVERAYVPQGLKPCPFKTMARGESGGFLVDREAAAMNGAQLGGGKWESFVYCGEAAMKGAERAEFDGMGGPERLGRPFRE